MKATQACALFLLILLLCPLAAQAGTLGPALSYNELLALVRQARDGDVLLVSGDLSATDEVLVTPALLEITGDGKRRCAICTSAILPLSFQISPCSILSRWTAYPTSSCARFA